MKTTHYLLLSIMVLTLSCGGTQEPNEEPPVWRPGTGEKIPVPTSTITYRAFDGTEYERYPWEGKKLTLLSETNELDPVTMKRWLDGVDGAYNYYAVCTGREPWNQGMATYINERSTIASVPTTCGAGCGYLGATGVEIMSGLFTEIYQSIHSDNQFSQVLFYELGRNFWFYSDQLQYKQNDPVVTGYAVFMRFVVVEAASLQGAPFNSWTFPEFKNTVRGLLDLYLNNPSLTWENTLGQGAGYPGVLGGTDLFASFCFYLMEHYGGKAWVENVWKHASQRPNAATTQDAVDNFIIAASQAAGTNLTALFQAWRWPISDAAVDFLNK
jgi:hypothetical protein